jgi:hypothetical protein
MTNADKLRAARPMNPTSVTLAKWLAHGKEMLSALAPEIDTLTARLATAVATGTKATEDWAEQRLADATNDARRLRLIIEAGEKEIPALEAAEAQATEALQIAREDVTKKRAAFLARVDKEYTAPATVLASLLAEEREVLAASRRYYTAHLAAPTLARAAVSNDLGPLTIFAKGQTVGLLGDCISTLPALIDQDSPESPRPRHWPQAVVAPPAPPAEPRPAPGPSTLRSWTTTQEFAPPHTDVMGPPPLAPAYADAAARALT